MAQSLNFKKLRTIENDNQFYLLNNTRKQDEVSRFELVSGSGEVAFIDSNLSVDSASGRGSWGFTGEGRWLVDKVLPVNTTLGVGGHISYRANVAGGIISVGVECFNAEMISLGDNGGFLLEESSLTTAWQFKEGYVRLVSPTDIANFKPNTRFVRFFIDINTNPGLIRLDNINLLPMNFASIALYS